MKKFLLIFFGLLLFSLFLPKTTLANCVPSVACDSNSKSNPTSCQYNGGLWCCHDPNECVALQGVPTPKPGTPTIVPMGYNQNGQELCADGKSINTAIGCIPVLNDDKGASFMGWVLRWAVGIGGGIAFLIILYGSFMVMTSQGNPERLKVGQELLTSAISGLLLLIFSIFILRFIGVDILGLGAFGFGK